MMTTCLNCISHTSLQQVETHGTEKYLENTQPSCALVAYSTASLLKHAEAAQANGMSQVDFCRRLLSPENLQWLKYVQCRNYYQKYKIRKYGTDVGLLYAATEQNLPQLVDVMAKGLADVNKIGGRYGNALQFACHYGHEDIVECLINNGANVNASGGEHKYAMLAAVLSKKLRHR